MPPSTSRCHISPLLAAHCPLVVARLAGLIVLGMRSRWCAAVLAVIVALAAVFKHPWFTSMWSSEEYTLDFVVGYEGVKVRGGERAAARGRCCSSPQVARRRNSPLSLARRSLPAPPHSPVPRPAATQVPGWLYSDHQRYFFFQQLSTAGALLQLVVHGPGRLVRL